MKTFLLFLAVLFAPSIVLALSFALTWLAFAFAFAGLAFGFIVRARPSTPLIVLQVFSFLSTVSPCHRKFLETFDLECSIADKSIGTGCVFLRTNSPSSISLP